MIRALILRAPGTNCDAETAFAFQLAGASPDVVHLNRWLESPLLADKYQILCLPGGFSYGDDVAAGKIFATRLGRHLGDRLLAFRDADKLILGICNGFQTLLKTNLFDVPGVPSPQATLAWNDAGRFLDCWVQLEADGRKCPFLNDIQKLELPIAHAEGNFRVRDDHAFQQLEHAGQLVLRYAPGDNPNGSVGDVAGICDPTGRVLGLMPHPERYVDFTQHPQWTRRRWNCDAAANERPGAGLQVFRNAVRYFA